MNLNPADVADMLAKLNWSGVPHEHQIAVSAAMATLKGLAPPQPKSNVVALPVKPRTCWTSICNLNGDRIWTSSHFGPEGAWGWIVESVAHEHSVSEDQITGLEVDIDAEPDSKFRDLVCVDGVPVYGIEHWVSK